MLAALVLAAVLLPPAQYDRAPSVSVDVIEGTAREVNRHCRRMAGYRGRLRIEACAQVSADRCIIIWPKGKPRSGAIWRHEIGHCNGWRH